jgi:nicotinamidase-related amidase
MELEASSTAVLALHFQHDIVANDGRFAPTFSALAEAGGIVARTAELLAAARAAGALVVYTRACFRPGYVGVVQNGPLFAALPAMGALVDGDPGTEILPELAPEAGDVVVDQRRISGFFGSDLDTVLRAHGITTVVLTGVATNITVLATAFEALNLGYRTIVASDCCSADEESTHDAVLKTVAFIGEVSDAKELMASLA